LGGFGEEGIEVEESGGHGEVAGGGARPLVGGAIPIEFHAILIRVAEVEGLAYAVVGGAIEGDVGGDETAEGVGEGGPGGVEDGDVIEAGCMGGRRGAAGAVPGVQADVMVVSAGEEEGGAGAVTLCHFETQHVAIECDCAVKIGDLQVNVADAGLGVNGVCWDSHGAGARVNLCG
jgi:hypothetical protein